MRRLGRWAILACGIAVAACSPTIGPVVESVQVLVVLDSLDQLLRIIPVDSLNIVHTLAFNTNGSIALKMAVSGGLAAIGAGDSVMLVDLAQRRTRCTEKLTGRFPVGAVSFDDSGQVRTATTQSDVVNRVDPTTPGQTCGTQHDVVPGGPQGFGAARSIVFVVIGNRKSCLPVTIDCAEDPSWLATLVGDSVPLSGPGNASGAALGPDGFLYVAVAGNGNPNGRLAQVDPVSRRETRRFRCSPGCRLSSHRTAWAGCSSRVRSTA